jgi:hypothetical protein
MEPTFMYFLALEEDGVLGQNVGIRHAQNG